MANKGRLYERLFQRDLGLISAPLSYLPDRVLWTHTAAIAGTLLLGWHLQNSASTPGVVDLDAGTVEYEIPPPPLANPATKWIWRWELTFDANLFTWWKGFYNGATLMGWQRSKGTSNEHFITASGAYSGIVNGALFNGATGSLGREARWSE